MHKPCLQPSVFKSTTSNFHTEGSMIQELQYLRDELNQKIKFSGDHPQKVINMIFLIWGATSFFLGTNQIKFGDNVLNYLLIVTIFIFSNLILFFSIRRIEGNMEGFIRIAAYITVFYERRPSKTAKVGVNNNISWEIASNELGSYIESNVKYKSWFIWKGEYMIFMIFSTLVILAFMVMSVITGKFEEIFKIFEFSIICFYLLVSVWLLRKTNGLFKSFSETKKKYLKAFFQYSLDTGHYTKEEIEERFGDFWRKLT